jgi:hypothetical protein
MAVSEILDDVAQSIVEITGLSPELAKQLAGLVSDFCASAAIAELSGDQDKIDAHNAAVISAGLTCPVPAVGAALIECALVN